MWVGRGATLAACAVASASVLVLSPPAADAACSWSFNWYCSSAGCTRITGRSTGTVGGFATEDACRSAISQFRRSSPGIGVGSCSRTGMCDEGGTVRRGPAPHGGRGTGDGVAPPVETEPPYDAEAERRRLEEEDEMRRQAEESERLAREQAERLAAQEKLNRDRMDVLKGMKGVDFDGAGGAGASSGGLGLKSSTPTLGLKSSSDGGLALKSSTPPPEAEKGPLFGKGTKDSAPPIVGEGAVDPLALKGVDGGRATNPAGRTRTEVPPPILGRVETLPEWIGRNWRSAPKHLQPMIQIALRDPAAMKELMYRHPTEIGEWYRDSTKEGFARKLAREFADPDATWRAKSRAWWNDPMHRQWIGDAAVMVLTPLAAQWLAGARAPAAAEEVSAASSWQAEVSAAYRWRHEAKASGEFYNFPTVYRGKEPKIPKWLFNENPYADPFAKPGTVANRWTGTRTTVWTDAEEVLIRRTPGGDKALRAADEEFFRAITGETQW